MLGNLATLDAAAQAASFIVGRNKPLAGLSIKYWWVTVPMLAAIGTALWARQKKKDWSVHGVAHDVAMPLVTVAAIVTIAEWAKKQSIQVGDGAQAIHGFVKEAEFVAPKGR